ncbi:hypothetical protein TWF694_011103 [Orbilia ellipsospora]|uniref:Capsule polysaccharide biosynthesis protein n=1 Tax=Orbilia ellipsospora TaxID=2528407 RepID=A0AAV9X814_9PEZI
MIPETKFSIPAEFSSQLKNCKSLDNRSDEEILASLSRYSPVQDEKNIWAFWHSGISNLPDWCARNVANWSRRCGPSWNIHIIDAIPESPNYFLKWIEPDLLPKVVLEHRIPGPWTGQHTADFLRGAFLYKYGGVFMDVGVILIRSPDRIFWKHLTAPGSPYRIFTPLMYEAVMANHLVGARKGDPFIKAWHDLFIRVYQRSDENNGTLHPLLDFSRGFDFTKAADAGFRWNWNAEPEVLWEYITQVVAWVRLCIIDGGGKEINWANYAKDHILYSLALSENYLASDMFNFQAQPILDALSVSLDADKQSSEYQAAYQLVWRLLAQSSMMKITSGTALLKEPELGQLLKLPENKGKDMKPGTFAELLRFGSVNFEQLREEVELVEYKKPEIILSKGVFEV